MNKVHITAIRQTIYHDLMEKYDNPMSAMTIDHMALIGLLARMI